jgi:hypothetical protein
VQHSAASVHCTRPPPAADSPACAGAGRSSTHHLHPQPIARLHAQVLGAAFYASVVGHMALLVSNLSATRSRHMQRKDLVGDAMRYFRLPRPLQDRVHRYFEYISTFSHPGAPPVGLGLCALRSGLVRRLLLR